jgi:hypothetical protein
MIHGQLLTDEDIGLCTCEAGHPLQDDDSRKAVSDFHI